MPEFLTTHGISDRLQRIIREAKEVLVLVSPYLQTNPKIRELLELKSRSNTHIRVIYGKRDLRPEEQEWIETIPSIELCFRQPLHAKCYLNEKEAILTSMNLYQFSELHNDEWGILVPKTGDDDQGRLYRKIYEEAEHVAKLSDKIREVPRAERAPGFRGFVRRLTTRVQDGDSQEATASEPASAINLDVAAVTDFAGPGIDVFRPDLRQTSASAFGQPVPGIPEAGFCIRCQTGVPANPAEPYCNRCYRTWIRYKNKEYEETFCHLCGDVETTSMAKPMCLGCYRTYKDAFA